METTDEDNKFTGLSRLVKKISSDFSATLRQNASSAHMKKQSMKSKNREYYQSLKVEIDDLAKLLPLPTKATTKLDQMSVIRLTLSYLMMRQLFPKGLGDEWGSAVPDTFPSDGFIQKDLSLHLLQSLDGFVFVLAADARIIYVSDSACIHLGFKAEELTGKYISDFIHCSDYEEIKLLLNRQEAIPPQIFSNDDIEIPTSFWLRMKCMFAKRTADLDPDGYKAIQCSGYLKLRNSIFPSSEGTAATNFCNQVVGLVAVGHPLSSTNSTKIKISSYTFTFQAGLGFTLLTLDPRIFPLTGYDTNYLTGKCFYKFVHPKDCLNLRQVHSTLLNKGHAITRYYRLLTCSGGWIWIQSLFTIIFNKRRIQPRGILAVNHILSECQYPEMLFDKVQMNKLSTNFYQSDNEISAKRFRFSQTVDNAMPNLKMESSASDPFLTRNSFQRSNSPVVQSVTTSTDAVSSHTSMFYKCDQKDLQLQSALFEFGQILKTYPMNDGNERLLQSNLASAADTVYHKPKNAFHHFHTSVPFMNTGSTLDYSSFYNEPLRNPNIYQKSPLTSELDKAPLNNSGMSGYICTQNADSKYLSSHGDSKYVPDDKELSYYVEYICSNFSDPTKECEDACKNSLIPTPPKSNRDIFNSTSSVELELHNFPRNSTHDGIRSDLYFCKSPNPENEGYKLEDTLHYTSMTDQNLPFTTDKSYGEMHSISSANEYFSTMNNSLANVEQSLVQKEANSVVPANDKTDNLMKLSNRLYYETDQGISPFDFNVSNVHSGNLIPISQYNEVTASREQIREQKHFLTHSPLDNSNRFCDYANQCTLPNSVMPDSVRGVKSIYSSDSISYNIESLEFIPPSYTSDNVFITSL